MKYNLDTTLYASYGMNTNHYEMATRCPNARSLGRFDISGHKLVFRGVADIIEDADSTLQTVLWEITPMCEEALDSLEGFPHMYGKKYITIMIDGYEHEVMLYKMNQRTSYYSPSVIYEELLLEGYETFGLSLDQIFDAPGYDIEDDLYDDDDYTRYTYRKALNRSFGRHPG